jgi:hypothetical protein
MSAHTCDRCPQRSPRMGPTDRSPAHTCCCPSTLPLPRESERTCDRSRRRCGYRVRVGPSPVRSCCFPSSRRHRRVSARSCVHGSRISVHRVRVGPSPVRSCCFPSSQQRRKASGHRCDRYPGRSGCRDPSYRRLVRRRWRPSSRRPRPVLTHRNGIDRRQPVSPRPTRGRPLKRASALRRVQRQRLVGTPS